MSPSGACSSGRHGAYHGVTLGAMSLSGSCFSMRNDIYGPSGLGISAARPARADPESLRQGARYSSDAARIEAAIIEAGPERIAGVVVDPMSTASGSRHSAGLRPACALQEESADRRRHGVLLIVDEVITAWGHAGASCSRPSSPACARRRHGVKGLGSGYMPIGAALVDERITAAFSGPDGFLAHGQTYAVVTRRPVR